VLPERVHVALRRRQELRYGENPHQAAALYLPADGNGRTGGGEAAPGKELLTIIRDLEARAAWRRNFPIPRR